MHLFKSFGSSNNAVALEAPQASIDEMNFAFIDMGQGDCTIISCPNNRVYIVDCGSSGGLEDDAFAAAQALVRQWENGNGVWVVLTHPDKDHYNKLISLLTPKPKVGLSTIFFSRAKSDKSPLGYYKESALGRNLGILGNPLLVEVTLNSTAHTVKKWVSLYDYESPLSENIPATGYVIASGTTTSGQAWSLTIVAGNVTTKSKVSSQQSNVVSLCTVAQVGTEKLVLTGDATTETLAYLQSAQSGHITNASLFQLPHHGSASSTPTTTFKNTVNPESILVSVGMLNDSYNLPRYDVLNAWSGGSRLRNANYVLDYWKTPGEVDGYDSHSDLQAILTDTWKDYTVLNNDSRTFFWLSDPADASPGKSGTGFYGFTYDGYFLYRVTCTKDIYETGILGSKEAGIM